MTNAHTKVCLTDDCDVVLSVHNREDRCSAHRWMRRRGMVEEQHRHPIRSEGNLDLRHVGVRE